MEDIMSTTVKNGQVQITAVSQLDVSTSDGISGADPSLSAFSTDEVQVVDTSSGLEDSQEAPSLLVEVDDVEKDEDVDAPAAVISLMLPETAQAVEMVGGGLQMEPSQESAGGSSSVLCEGVLQSDDHHLVLEDGQALQEVQFVDGSTAFQVKGQFDTEDGTTIVEGQAIQFDDGSTAYIHQVSADKLQNFEEGQAVQLEDGSTAYILRAPLKDDSQSSIQAVHLEDGTTALIQGTVTTFTGPDDDDGSLSNLDHFASPTVAVNIEMTGKMFRCLQRGCEKTFSSAHHLKVHIRSHTGEKPFACEYPTCGKAFATSYGLKSHIRVHTGEKPYKCPKAPCMKAFKTSGDLQKHIRTHTGEKPFKCPFEGCNKAFTTANIRKVHIRTHTGEKPYVCKEEGCTRAFASATNYKNHMRIHSGEKPYVCTVAGCGRRFTEYSSLYKHHVVHTHHKPYSCQMCGKHYRQTSTLAQHKRTAHGILDVCDEDMQVTVGTTTDGLGEDAKTLHLSAISIPKSTASLTTVASTSSTPLYQPKQTIIIDTHAVTQAVTATSTSGRQRHVTMVASLDPETGLTTIEPADESMDGPEFHVVATPALGEQDDLQHVLVATPISIQQGIGLKMETATSTNHNTQNEGDSLNQPITADLTTDSANSEET